MKSFLLFLFLFASPVHAFVFLSGPKKAKLPNSPASPVVDFYWDGSSTTMNNLDSFLGGRWAGLSDHDAMKQALLYAMNSWSEVPGSYLRLNLIEEPGVDLDSEDNRNVIAVKHDSNITSSAYASPQVDRKVIRDCDISISDSSVDAKAMVYTLTHELGHCVGLGHAHTNYKSIMGYSRGGAIHLGADDMAGLIYLYADPNYYDGTHKEYMACGLVKRNVRNSRAAASFSFLLPLLCAGYFLRRSKRRS